MNWLECKIIEQRPGKVSGAPVIRGTRVRPDDILNNLDLRPEEIADDFDLRLEDVREVLAFYHMHQAALASHP